MMYGGLGNLRKKKHVFSHEKVVTLQQKICNQPLKVTDVKKPLKKLMHLCFMI